ncbi:MAG TPA: hypothetical protein VMV62_00170 [Candidatus Paceibacterota bacterium]|nr:hypothetical protein [Candidatus Paceibacterota bacterium]
MKDSVQVPIQHQSGFSCRVLRVITDRLRESFQFQETAAALRRVRGSEVSRRAAGKGEALMRTLDVIDVFPLERFDATEHFVIDLSNEAPMKIACLSPEFKARYLPIVDGKARAGRLAVSRLHDFCYDADIIDRLGGEGRARVTLGQYFGAFAGQPHGDLGPLLTNGRAVIGYIPDINGDLGAVYGYWFRGGWGFAVRPLIPPIRWGPGRLILSPRPLRSVR